MRVLIAFYSATGQTAKMADYIAEGLRFSGNEAVVKKIENIKDTAELAGYEGYIFGSPTFSLDVPGVMKTFFTKVDKAILGGRLGGSFGSYRHDISYKHDNYGPGIIFDILQNVYEMKPFELGPFTLQEDAVDTGEGMKACQDYGRVFGEGLGGR